LDLNSSERHQQLYYYSKIQEERKRVLRDSYEEKYPFKPSINQNVRSSRTEMNFFERQNQDCKDREYKQKAIEEMNSTNNIRKTLVPKILNPSPSDQIVGCVERRTDLHWEQDCTILPCKPSRKSTL